MTLLKNAVAAIGLKGFPFGTHSATLGLRPGLGTLPLVGGVSQSYEQMYRGQLWLNVVINKLARGVGRLPLKTYALGADGERLRQRDGWLADSLARPMPGKPPFAWKQAIVGKHLRLRERRGCEGSSRAGQASDRAVDLLVPLLGARSREVGASRGIRLPRCCRPAGLTFARRWSASWTGRRSATSPRLGVDELCL